MDKLNNSQIINKRRVLYVVLIVVLFINPLLSARASNHLQTNTAQARALSLLEQLTPEEKVGQLFLVTFRGQEVGANTTIYELAVNHHIGGVTLQASNDNFTSGEASLNRIITLNRQLQLNRWSASQRQNLNPSTGESFTPAFIPMFIGISQEGDGYPYDQIITGVTPLPNEMAIGATWNPDLASQVGQVMGAELSALGFNLLLGPSLDVLETPISGSASDLGTRTFGGDPFWVGEMGLAYINGVHQGSDGKVALIAKHFPGNGGADRPPEEEVATVRKSFEQLRNFDLVPFFAVTGEAPQLQSQVDGLLAAHIRYQGFQENIRVTTRPVSFDPQAFNMLMSLPALESWRQSGGVIISDNLASQAVRRFYELTGQEYDLHRVALNAFLAGNDMVYIGDFEELSEGDPTETVINTLDNFAQKYREDPAFAQRVDESVLRILTLKFRIYDNFVLGDILPNPQDVENIGISEEISFEVARQAATIISPSLEELNDTAPDPPNFSDRIIFFTDERQAKQCSSCPEQSLLPVDALESAVIRLYGPQAGGQVLPNYLNSFSFRELERFLDGEGDNEFLSNALTRSHWIVFSMLNVTNEAPSSNALRRFLSERPGLLQQKRLVVFAFNGPYFLDATNISKITAYYGLYSKTPQFVDVAARLLFRELRPVGAVPVSVPGVGYDLISATSPDPDQVIPLYIDIQGDSGEDTSTPTPMPTPDFRIGDFISVRTGVILDHNGNKVPDGTPVQFIITLGGEVSSLPERETTVDGIANTTIQVSNPGLLEIRAESEPAKQSQVLRFDIPPLTNGVVTVPVTTTPTQAPTQTVSPTPQATRVAPIETVQPEGPPPGRPSLSDWIISILITGLIGIVFYRLSALFGQIRWGVRGSLFIFIGGLLSYSYLAFSLPGSELMFDSIGTWTILITTSAGAVGGILITWGWRTFTKETANEKT